MLTDLGKDQKVLRCLHQVGPLKLYLDENEPKWRVPHPEMPTPASGLLNPRLPQQTEASFD